MGHGNVKEGIPVITPTDTTFTLATSITVHELEAHLSAVSGTKVVFLESCHIGNFIARGNNSFNNMIIGIFAKNTKDLLNKENYQVLVSSSGEQYTWTHGTWSYFCEGLLNGCENLNADVNGDRIIDLTELYNYVDEWVDEHLEGACAGQDAQIYPEQSIFPIVEY